MQAVNSNTKQELSLAHNPFHAVNALPNGVDYANNTSGMQKFIDTNNLGALSNYHLQVTHILLNYLILDSSNDAKRTPQIFS